MSIFRSCHCLLVISMLVAVAMVNHRAHAAGTRSEIQDEADLFRGESIDAALAKLRGLDSETHVSTVIRTVESLKGQTLQEAATEFAKVSGSNGLVVLIARRETKIEVLVAHRVERLLPKETANSIRDAFVKEFRKKDFDAGLKQGVDAIVSVFRAAVKDGKVPVAGDNSNLEPKAGTTSIPSLVQSQKEHNNPDRKVDSSLFRNVGIGTTPAPITRGHTRLTLHGAQAIVEAAKSHAESMKLKSNIWVVDDGGHPLAFARMDGARPASAYTAMTKAVSAATFRQATGPLPPGSSSPDPLLNLGIQNAASASGGTITTLLGGVPIVVEDQVIGAVGVGGGTGEQDAVVAKAGIQAFLELLHQREQPKQGSSETHFEGADSTKQKRESSSSKQGDF